MTIYALPTLITGFIFDMDATLYTHHEYAELQNVVLVRRLADLQGKSYDDMRAEVEAYRGNWSAANGGKKLSLGNAMAAFGISIAEGIQWREELIHPEDFIRRDEELRRSLRELAARAGLAVVTNNPVSVARRTLAVLGVEDLFDALVGLDTFAVSKPHAPSFLKAAADLGSPPEACVAVGDRYDIDLALPLELGMGGVLVSGAEDVYLLPKALADRLPRAARAAPAKR